MTDLTDAKLANLLVPLRGHIVKEPDQFARSQISNFAETIQNYLGATPEHRPFMRTQVIKARERLENFRARQQQREG